MEHTEADVEHGTLQVRRRSVASMAAQLRGKTILHGLLMKTHHL